MDKCPQCGYTEVQENKKFSHAVHCYVNVESGKVDGMYNTDEEFITVQPKGSSKQTKLQRQDKWEEVKAKAAEKKGEDLAKAATDKAAPSSSAPKVPVTTSSATK